MPLSTFLNAKTPTQLRGLQWLSLSETGHVVTRVITDDGGGGGTATWTAGTALPCRIDPLSGVGEVVTAGRINDRSTHVVTIPAGAGTALGVEARFSIGGRGTFEVTALRERTAEWSTRFEVVEL